MRFRLALPLVAFLLVPSSARAQGAGTGGRSDVGGGGRCSEAEIFSYYEVWQPATAYTTMAACPPYATISVITPEIVTGYTLPAHDDRAAMATTRAGFGQLGIQAAVDGAMQGFMTATSFDTWTFTSGPSVANVVFYWALTANLSASTASSPVEGSFTFVPATQNFGNTVGIDLTATAEQSFNAFYSSALTVTMATSGSEFAFGSYLYGELNTRNTTDPCVDLNTICQQHGAMDVNTSIVAVQFLDQNGNDISRQVSFTTASGAQYAIMTPEPATMVLTATGLIGLAVAGWRRRQSGAVDSSLTT